MYALYNTDNNVTCLSLPSLLFENRKIIFRTIFHLLTICTIFHTSTTPYNLCTLRPNVWFKKKQLHTSKSTPPLFLTRSSTSHPVHSHTIPISFFLLFPFPSLLSPETSLTPIEGVSTRTH